MAKKKKAGVASETRPAEGAIDPEQEGLLYDAVTGDNAAAVRRILGRHPGLRAAELPMGMSWLHMAAEEGALAAAKALVAAGLRVDEPARGDPETPLHYAAAEGHEAVARWLLDSGAEVNAADKYGRTPLMNAARDGHAAMVKLLLKRGADSAKSYGKPLQDAMSVARSRGHEDVVRLLDAAGAGAGARGGKDGRGAGPGRGAKAGVKKGDARDGAGAKLPSAAASANEAGADRPARQRIIDHVAGFLGPVKELALTEIVPGTVRLAINVVPARKDRKFLTLFTTGMSGRAMRAAKGTACPPRAELIIDLPARWPLETKAFKNPDHYWPVEWLRVIAHHAHGNGVCLAHGDTLGNGEPPEPFAPGTRLSCVLLLRHAEVEPLQMGRAQAVEFYHVIPIYDEERKLYEAEGLAALVKRFMKDGVDMAVDPKRKNVAARRK